MSRRRRYAAGALIAGLGGLGMVVQSTPAFAASSPSAAEQFIADINALRAQVGVGHLTENSSLDAMAYNWTIRLENAGTLSHNPSLAADAPSNWRRLGENVGVGPNVSALQLAFTNSPEHYANMVLGAYNQIGVSVQIDSNGAMWVTEDYMQAPVAAAAPAPVATTVARPAPAPAPVVTVAPVHQTPAPVTRSVSSTPAPVVHVSTPAPVSRPTVAASSAASIPSHPATASAPPPSVAPRVSAATASNPSTGATAAASAPLAAAGSSPKANPVVQTSAHHRITSLMPVAAGGSGATSASPMALTTKKLATWIRDASVPAALLVGLILFLRPRRHSRRPLTA